MGIFGICVSTMALSKNGPTSVRATPNFIEPHRKNIEIFRQLQKQNIPYVRFDGDADEVEGLEKFDW